MMKRLLDLTAASIALLVLSPLFVGIAIAVRLTSRGPVLFRSKRVGRENHLFEMYKFRTMATDAPQVATHLLANPSKHLTPIGGFLRKTSLDELPQLIDVIKGDMSLVGPRPALFNQEDLVSLRTQAGVDALLPGITGWAQVNGRDELPIAAKVDFDAFYLQHRSFLLDLKILGLTVIRVFQRDGVSH
jgi:O-antigen biosynthesis protein WbqP